MIELVRVPSKSKRNGASRPGPPRRPRSLYAFIEGASLGKIRSNDIPDAFTLAALIATGKMIVTNVSRTIMGPFFLSSSCLERRIQKLPGGVLILIDTFLCSSRWLSSNGSVIYSSLSCNCAVARVGSGCRRTIQLPKREYNSAGTKRRFDAIQLPIATAAPTPTLFSISKGRTIKPRKVHISVKPLRMTTWPPPASIS